MSLEKLGPEISQEGTKRELPVEDDSSIILLGGILKELKILNLHMAVITDNKFTKQDVE